MSDLSPQCACRLNRSTQHFILKEGKFGFKLEKMKSELSSFRNPN